LFSFIGLIPNESKKHEKEEEGDGRLAREKLMKNWSQSYKRENLSLQNKSHIF
jgi:hypothetical protein